MRKAFTMIELIFVIVVLGILSSIAISKMAVTRDDAEIAKGRAQIAAIRNAITLTRNTNMLQGLTPLWPSTLDKSATANTEDQSLFDLYVNDDGDDVQLLDYALISKDQNGYWMKTAANEYTYKVMNTDVNFTYTASSGRFTCDRGTGATEVQKLCRNLID